MALLFRCFPLFFPLCYCSYPISHGDEQAHPFIPGSQGENTSRPYLEWTGRGWTVLRLGNFKGLVLDFLPNGLVEEE